MIPKNLFFQKCYMGIKKAEFDADFESVLKVRDKYYTKKLITKK
jgi:hypothetical protein